MPGPVPPGICSDWRRVLPIIWKRYFRGNMASLAAIPSFLGLLDQTSFSSSGSVIPVAFGRTQQFQAVLPVLKRRVKVKGLTQLAAASDLYHSTKVRKLVG